MTDELKYYFSVFLRRFHYFLIVAIVISAAGITVAMMLPTRYSSEAVLLIESPQIDPDLASSTVRIDPQEQLQIMEQRLMARANLLEIANEVGVYDNAGRRPFPDEIVVKMRGATTFRASRGRNAAPIFNIGFSADNPQKTAQVVSAYITKILEDNTELRVDAAREQVAFFEDQVERLSVDLARKSAEILEFKNANLDALPENLQYQLDRQADLRDRLSGISREISSLDQQRERLILVVNATGGTGGQDLRSPEQRQLDEKKNQLTAALTTLSEQHPTVRILRNEIANLEAQVAGQSPADTGEQDRQRASLLDIQLSEIDSRVEALENERKTIQVELEDLRRNIEATPSNSVALEGLQRDYANLQTQYNTAEQRAHAAVTGALIEDGAKGERITVISQPVAPREPSSPNRPLIAAGSIGFGMFAGLALVVLLELINRSIRRPADLVRGLGITPLATLPMIRTPGEIARRRGIVFTLILAASIGMVGLIYIVHTEVMPIDLIADRAISKIGL
ncbi:MAG: lipopolysaccharide biosynthesis protein [Pseudomonadota bacterium]